MSGLITLSRPSRWRWRAEYVLNTVPHSDDAWTARGALRKSHRSLRAHLDFLTWEVRVTGNTNPVIAETIQAITRELETDR